MTRALALALALASPGCAMLGYSEVGIYFQHGTDIQKSFALQWQRDAGKGAGYIVQDCHVPAIVGVPTWAVPSCESCDGERCP